MKIKITQYMSFILFHIQNITKTFSNIHPNLKKKLQQGLSYCLIPLDIGGTYRSDKGPVWVVHRYALPCVGTFDMA